MSTWANRPSNEIAGAVPGAIYNFYGDVISQTKPDGFSTNFVLYWDGDLLSELFDSATAEGPVLFPSTTGKTIP